MSLKTDLQGVEERASECQGRVAVDSHDLEDGLAC